MLRKWWLAGVLAAFAILCPSTGHAMERADMDRLLDCSEGME